MLYSLARATALVALLSPVLSIALDTPGLKSDLVWKRDGKRDIGRRGREHHEHDHYHHGRHRHDYDNCRHGPQTRDCWDGSFTIDTDMDVKWPNTGRVVRVGSSNLCLGLQAHDA